MLVLRDLLLGPKRFTDLQRGLPRLATNVLTQRLKQLERDGVVRRRRLQPPAASTVYELTEYGREFEPVLLAFGRWGAKSLGAPSPGAVTRPEWLCVALKAFFSADAARSVRATIDLGLGGERYALRIDRGTLEASVGAPAVADLGLTCDVPTLLGFLHGAPVPAHALGAEGDLGLLERLPAIFAFGSERPERAGAPAA